MSSDLSIGLADLISEIEDHEKLCLTFIPLSPRKLRSRGYNQAEMLARGVADKLNLPVLDLLERKNQDETQVVSRTKVARQENIRGVFSVKPGAELPPKIILIDDVVTTGATVEEASKVLKRAGAQSIIVAAVAMGVPTP